jgi:hypothetical protein
MEFLKATFLTSVWLATLWPLNIIYILCGLVSPNLWIALLVGYGVALALLDSANHQFIPTAYSGAALHASLLVALTSGAKWWAQEELRD